MSAIAFYFASRLSETLHCIVGIIDCYWGGSSITCWMSREQLAKLESGKNYLEEYAALVGEKSSQQYTKEMEEYNCAYQHWLKSTEEVRHRGKKSIKFAENVRGRSQLGGSRRFVPMDFMKQ